MYYIWIKKDKKRMILETQKMKEKEDQDPKYWVTDFSRDFRRPFPLYASP